MLKRSLLYVEEFENEYVNTLIKNRDIQLILLRFRQSMHFTSSHLDETKAIATFIYDRKQSVDAECKRFNKFCNDAGIRIDYFYNDSEYNQECIQAFASRLALTGALSEKQARLVRDKIYMKDKIRELGYKTVNYQTISSIGEVNTFAEENGGYPIIVKWRSGMSSKEVYKVSDQEELVKIGLDLESGRYMVETYCPYKVWCIDTVVYGGIPVFVFPSWLPFTNLEFAKNKNRFAQITVNPKSNVMNFDMQRLVWNIIADIGLMNGCLHLEAFIDYEGVPIICEFAWRTPGDHMLSNHSLAYGIDVYKALTDAITGRRPLMKIVSKPKCVGDMFLPMKEGRVKYISSYEDLSSFPGVIRGSVDYGVGDIVKPRQQYNDCSGWVQLEGKDVSEVMDKMATVYKAFILETEPIT